MSRRQAPHAGPQQPEEATEGGGRWGRTGRTMIYFYQVGHGGLVKIGRSQSVNGRGRLIQSWEPEKVRLIRSLDAPNWGEAFARLQALAEKEHCTVSVMAEKIIAAQMARWRRI
jgi:hypothetical protein